MRQSHPVTTPSDLGRKKAQQGNRNNPLPADDAAGLLLGLVPGVLDFFCDGLTANLIEIGDIDQRAGLGECFGDGGANARARPGDGGGAGGDHAEDLRRLSLAIYAKASAHAQERGLILADTKFEFGLTAKGIVLADEVLTPDSSRFWPSEGYRPGAAQPSFDKQFVRDYLEAVGWNKQPPAPELPENVVSKTQEKYEQALDLLTGPAL